MLKILILCITLCGFICYDIQTVAKTVAADTYNPTCNPTLKNKVKTYINSLDNVAISFIHHAAAQDYTGVLIISKPYRFRLNYDIPHPLLIVGTKNFVSIYDYDLDELSKVSVENNEFAFLLLKNIDDKSIDIIECTQDDNMINMIVMNKKSDMKSIVHFQNDPMKIISLSISGYDDEVEIIDFGSILPAKNLSSDLFILHHNDTPQRFSSDKLIQIIK